MSKMGSREICDVVLRAKSKQTLGSRTFLKGEPVLYFDTLKTSSMEGSADTVYAQGGKGNPRLIAWEGNKTLTFTMEDALLSPESLAILSGAGLVEANSSDSIMYVHQTSQVEITSSNYNASSKTFTVDGVAMVNGLTNTTYPIYIMELDDEGEIKTEPCIPSSVVVDTDKNQTTIGCKHVQETGKVVLIDYYVAKTAGKTLEISTNDFAGYYYLEASTLFRRQSDGLDLPAEFIIPNGKIQSNWSLSISADGDPSTFTFTMDAFPDYTKFNKEKKVLAAIQIIEEGYTDVSYARKDGVVDDNTVTSPIYIDKNGNGTVDSDDTEPLDDDHKASTSA